MVTQHAQVNPQSAIHNPQSKGEILVRAEGVGKKFCRNLKKSLWYGLKDVAAELNPFGKSSNPQSEALRPGEFWANKDISFELRRGECLGLIGRNGAGKTTLLKMLNGLIKPDAGHIEMRGRVGALIALGAGFNPILTGRENIYVNGSILGLTKREIDEKIDEIIHFAEIHDFIDAPVQSYSSGMQVRLGFAVATALEPDVLILDEVLAVGDAAFRAKCYNRVVELRKNAAVIFVSHNMEQIGRICDETILLSKGKCHYKGDIAEGVNQYEILNEEGEESGQSFLSCGNEIEDFKLDILNPEIQTGDPLRMIIKIKTSIDTSKCIFRFKIYNITGSGVAETNTHVSNFTEENADGWKMFRSAIRSVTLKQGRYILGFNLIDEHGDLAVWSYKEYNFLIAKQGLVGNSDCQMELCNI